ncbi:MAG: TolC family protein [Myxococcota bacterium]
MKLATVASILIVALCLSPPEARATGGERTLTFDAVRRSVERHDPRIRAAIERLRGAEGDVQAARGAFDPRLGGDFNVWTGNDGSFYQLRRGNVAITQPTTLWGSEIYAGYRIGLGEGVNDAWPTYLSDQTLSGGEVRAGINMPLFRGGPIDEERARRKRAIAKESAADYGLSATELDLELAAARAYWYWVSAGKRREVTEDLMHLAEERDEQLRRRLDAGSIAEFDVIDNERILYERRALLVRAERALEQAAFALSLFLRDDAGASVVPSPESLPAELDIEFIDPQPNDPILQRVVQCHPEAERVRAEVRAAEVDRALTRNQLGPELRGFFEYSRDFGEGTGTSFDQTLFGNVFKAGAVLEMPLLLRPERGRAAAATANVSAKRADLQLVEDQLRAQARDAASAVLAAEVQVGLAEGVVRTATKLAEGERRRFEAGSSNLVFVNLREQQAAFARIGYIQALAATAVEHVRWDVTTDVACR